MKFRIGGDLLSRSLSLSLFLVFAHPVQAQLSRRPLDESLIRDRITDLRLLVYHSPRMRRANTAINHYYPDRTHSRRVPHSSPSRLASRRDSFIHACNSPLTVPRESARGCLSTPPHTPPRTLVYIS